MSEKMNKGASDSLGDAVKNCTKSRIGLFGGSFDPIHFGHLNLAIQLFEACQLDEVLFCPAACSPFRQERPPVANSAHRLEMLRLSLEGIPHFQYTSIEIDRGEPSYMIDTLRALAAKDCTFRLIMSEETALHLDQWKEAPELLRLAPPLIGRRFSSAPLPEGAYATKVMEVSSSEIRERLKKKLYCGHLVPAKALDYIHTHSLYW